MRPTRRGIVLLGGAGVNPETLGGNRAAIWRQRADSRYEFGAYPNDTGVRVRGATRVGHATVSVTLDTYSHVTPDMQREAAEALDAVLP